MTASLSIIDESDGMIATFGTITGAEPMLPGELPQEEEYAHPEVRPQEPHDRGGARELFEREEIAGKLVKVDVGSGRCTVIMSSGIFSFAEEVAVKLRPIVGRRVAILCMAGVHVRPLSEA